MVAQPGSAFTAEEVAFFAGEHVVTIQARAPITALQLMDGDIGEMQAMRQEQVPLWLALFLKRRGKCRIIAPDWMSPDALEGALADERRHNDRFAPLPYGYLEVGYELLNGAEDDLEDSNRIRIALADIEDTRRAKVTRGLKNIDRSVTHIKLPDISATELNRIRGVATGALDSLKKLGAGVVNDTVGGGGGGGGNGGAGFGGSGYGGSGGGGGDGGNERLQAVLKRRRGQ